MPCNRAPGTGIFAIPGTSFQNWGQDFSITPTRIWEPTTIDQLVAIVQQAEADNLQVHAVGSGWSFTEVMATTDFIVKTASLNGTPIPVANAPAGFSPAPRGYGSSIPPKVGPQVPSKPLATLSETMSKTPYPNDPIFNALTASAKNRLLCHVEAGIKICDLYMWLEGIPSGITAHGNWFGYALGTLGGSGGQAITGAFSTSTHGGDDHDSNLNPIRPLPDMVQGITLIGPGGVEYFIQRGNTGGIVDPNLLAQLDPCLSGPGQIISNDDVFNAVVVSMGRMGVIYSVVLEVRPQYFLSESTAQYVWLADNPNTLVNNAGGTTTISQLRSDVGVRFLQILILPYGNFQQSQINGNKTASTPFVAPDSTGVTWVYFQDTSDALWKVKSDGTKQTQINGAFPASTPFVVPDSTGAGAWVYYEGMDNGLWKIRDDGSQQTLIGGNSTNSTPFVVPDPGGGGAWVYFQGTDNKLWKIRDDGTQQTQIGANFTASTPFVVPDTGGGGAWIYFQGTDLKLWKVRDDGSQQSQINGNSTASAPFVTQDGWVYFQGTDAKLWRVYTESVHTCYVTLRTEVDPSQFIPSNPSPTGASLIFSLACQAPPAALAQWVSQFIADLKLFMLGSLVVAALPLVGPLLAGLNIAAAQLLIDILSPLQNPSVTIGDYLAAAVNILTSLGLVSFAEWFTNSILSSFNPVGTRDDVSYRIMDTYNYVGTCYKANSVEVGFNADDTVYFDYISSVFGRIDNFASQNILTGAYISLRYCAGSEALLAIEQWPHTVCIEISGLAGLANEQQVLKAFEDETANHIGHDGRLPTVHWGQLNTRTATQVNAAFPKIDRWRSALVRLSAKGKISTFDNAFCQSHGLEPDGATVGGDLSCLEPLLLSDSDKKTRDISYLDLLLLSG